MTRRSLLKGLAVAPAAVAVAAEATPPPFHPMYRREERNGVSRLYCQQRDGSWVLLSESLPAPIGSMTGRAFFTEAQVAEIDRIALPRAPHHLDPLPGPMIIDTPGHAKGKPAVPTPLAVEPTPGLPYYRPAVLPAPLNRRIGAAPAVTRAAPATTTPDAPGAAMTPAVSSQSHRDARPKGGGRR